MYTSVPSHLYNRQALSSIPAVDSSDHIQTNMSVRRGIIWGISVHRINKGEAQIFSSVYIKKAIKNLEGRCTKAGFKM